MKTQFFASKHLALILENQMIIENSKHFFQNSVLVLLIIKSFSSYLTPYNIYLHILDQSSQTRSEDHFQIKSHRQFVTDCTTKTRRIPHAPSQYDLYFAFPNYKYSFCFIQQHSKQILLVFTLNLLKKVNIQKIIKHTNTIQTQLTLCNHLLSQR